MSRDQILENIRAALPFPEPFPLPEMDDLGITFEDKVETFAQMLRVVGGLPKTARSLQGVNAILQAQCAEHPKWASFCPGVESRGLDARANRGGHGYQDVDLVVVEGAFGVAENGAIWIPGSQVDHPAALVLSQHLAIVIRASDLVDNMHQAYRRLGAGGGLPQYGVFISGPSKTADIEQSLVIGAHGARSLTVFLLP